MYLKTITTDQLLGEDHLNELNIPHQDNLYPSLSQLESYRMNRRFMNSNVNQPYTHYTSNQYNQQQYMSPYDRSFNNISYLSNSVLENKWNTYLNRVNNQYFNQDSINHISNSNNQSYYTSLLSNSLDTSLPSSASSLSLLSAEATTATSLFRVHNPKISHPYLAGESQTEQILKYILNNYKSHERPNENSPDPTIVSVFIHIIDISSSFLHDMSQPNYLLRVKSNGQVLYSQKITMTLSCQMYLRKFPMDKQECTVNIGSYGYTIDQLKFIWHHDKPVTISDNLQLYIIDFYLIEDSFMYSSLKA
ncbi:Glycine receptor subunit alpha-2 [Schistosoma japonicum]|nr:Glycine receptor subunit alpha-2 [Schistosoma japonicum]